MPEFTLLIDGYASIPHLAERAWVRLTVTNNAYNKQTVANNTLETASFIEAQVADLQSRADDKSGSTASENEDDSKPIAHYSKTSLTSTSGLEYGEGPPKRTYTASIDFDIRFRDFAALGDFSARVSGVDHCEISSIEWRLLPATQRSFETRLRKEASADALQKAKDYCSVLCPDEILCIVPMNLTTQPGSLDRSAVHRGGTRMGVTRASSQQVAFTSASGGGSGGLTFSPQECRMESTVEIEFRVE